MPVSVTSKLTASSSGRKVRRHPHFATLRELQGVGDEVAEDLRHLALVGVEGGQAVRGLEDETQGLADEERPQHAAEGAEHALHLELDGAHGDLARLHLGEIEEVIDELGEGMGSLPDERHLLGLLRGEGPSIRSSRRWDSAVMELSGVRNSWLMFDRKRDLSSSARRR
jgi:hypothetical protein